MNDANPWTDWSADRASDGNFDRSLMSQELEMQLCGMFLAKVELLAHLPTDFRPDHMAFDETRKAFEAITAEAPSAAQGPIGARVAIALGNTPEARQLIADMMTAPVGYLPSLIAPYAARVTELYRRRQLLGVSIALRERTLDLTGTAPEAIISGVMSDLDNLLAAEPLATEAATLDQALDMALADAEEAATRGDPGGVKVGMPIVDSVYQGMGDGTLNILGGRPGMGKSALAMQWALEEALRARDDGAGGVFVQSLEMSAKQNGRRLLAYKAGVPIRDLKTGDIGFSRSLLARARQEIAGARMVIDETPRLTVPQITLRARAAARRFNGLRLLVVDHLHIIRPDDVSERNGMTAAVAKISHGLKALAKELSCPVLALAQLNRGVEGRDDKRPNLSDLRQSGDIEQDADTIAFVYRPEYYASKGDPEKRVNETVAQWQARVREHDEHKANLSGKAELIFEKVRDGEPRTVKLRFYGESTYFEEDRRQ